MLSMHLCALFIVTFTFLLNLFIVKLVGETYSFPGEFPSFVGVVGKDRVINCVGVLLSENKVLTPPYCAHNIASRRKRASASASSSSSSSSVPRKISTLKYNFYTISELAIVREEFVKEDMENRTVLAILQLKKTIKTSHQVNYTILPTTELPKKGSNCSIVGIRHGISKSNNETYEQIKDKVRLVEFCSLKNKWKLCGMGNESWNKTRIFKVPERAALFCIVDSIQVFYGFLLSNFPIEDLRNNSYRIYQFGNIYPHVNRIKQLKEMDLTTNVATKET